MNRRSQGLLYPIAGAPNVFERTIARFGRLGPIRCTVCGRWTVATGFSENLRETGICGGCGSTNRHRQVARIAVSAAAERLGRPVRCLADLGRERELVVYNTEASGPIHDQLVAMPGYRCSEYFGSDHPSGAIVDGTMHQDLQQLSFEDGAIDLMLSSDVLEHVPDPYRAHREIFRILRLGGHHVFTVPFHQQLFRDDVRATLGPDGEPRFHAEPIYHDDPIRPQGALVFTIFSLEMLVRLSELGFTTSMHRLSEPSRGIVGPNALVFDAVKS